jgi:Nucleoside diphosphate kinase
VARALDGRLRRPPDEIDWRRLTVTERKLELFPAEEGRPAACGVEVATEALGGRLPDVLTSLAVLVLQPDAIARRQVAPALEFLTAHGFSPVLALPFRLEVESARRLWRFQFNAITPDSKEIGEIVYCALPSLMLFLRDDRPEPGVPGSTRLTQMKGPSDPRTRTPAHLRTAIGAINKIFGSIHCPDEPIDILRETAILFGRDELRRLYADLGHALGPEAPAFDPGPAIARVYAAVPAHDVDVERAVARLLESLGALGDDARLRAPVRRLERVVRGESPLRWSRYCADLRAVGLDPHGWDPLLVASHRVRYDLPGASKLIESFSTPGYS